MSYPFFYSRFPQDEQDEQTGTGRGCVSWGLGITAALVLLALLAFVGYSDEQQAAQAQAEHKAWLDGVEAGRQQAQDDMADILADLHEQGRRLGRTQVACGAGL